MKSCYEVDRGCVEVAKGIWAEPGLRRVGGMVGRLFCFPIEGVRCNPMTPVAVDISMVTRVGLKEH